MINARFREYNYYTFGSENGYGQPVLSTEPVGTIKLAIYTSNLSTQDNVNYKDCNYIALTHAEVKDTYVIEFGEERLKVLYVNNEGRLKQAFLKAI